MLGSFIPFLVTEHNICWRNTSNFTLPSSKPPRRHTMREHKELIESCPLYRNWVCFLFFSQIPSQSTFAIFSRFIIKTTIKKFPFVYFVFQASDSVNAIKNFTRSVYTIWQYENSYNKINTCLLLGIIKKLLLTRISQRNWGDSKSWYFGLSGMMDEEGCVLSQHIKKIRTLGFYRPIFIPFEL